MARHHGGKDGVRIAMVVFASVKKLGKRLSNFAAAHTTQSLNQLQLDKGSVVFSPGEKNRYSFDAWKEAYSGKTVLEDSYEKLADGNYRVPVKALVPGAAETVRATLEVKDNSLKPEKVQFVTAKGIAYPFERSGNSYTITLTGGPAGDAQELFAVYPTDSTHYLTLGKLLVVSYTPKTHKVTLVPVGGAIINQQAVTQQLHQIFNPIGISYEVVEDESFRANQAWDSNNNGLLDVSPSALLSNGATGEMKELIKAYRNSHSIDKQTSYVFVLDESSKDGLLGEMARGEQFGYVFVKGASDASISRTLAHELGHGRYKLEHTFNGGIGLPKGTTDNFMDYASGTTLLKYQWDAIHDPGVVWGVLEKDGEGENVSNSSQIAIDDVETFISPAGKYITLPKNVGTVYFSTYDKYFKTGDVPTETHSPIGALSAFSIDGKLYYAIASNNKFIGYQCNEGEEKLYQEDLTFKNKPTSGIILLTTVEREQFIGYAGKFANQKSSDLKLQEDGSGELQKGVFIINVTATDLAKGYKELFKQSENGSFLVLPDVSYLVQQAFLVVDPATGKTTEDYLKAVLNQNSTLGEVLTQFALIYEGPEAIRLFNSCEQESKERLWQRIAIAYRTELERKIQSGELGNGLIEKTAVSQLEEQLIKSGFEALQNLQAASQVRDAVAKATSVNEIYNTIKANYSSCTFKALDVVTRKEILRWLFKSDEDYWEVNSKNVVYDLLKETPADQQKEILVAFTENRYDWLYSLWHKGSFEYATPVIRQLTEWLGKYYAQLNLPVTTEDVLFGDITGFSAVKIPVGEKPYLLGLENENSYALPGNLTVRVNQYHTTGSEELTGSGKITFKQSYLTQDPTTYISAPGQAPERRATLAEYEAALEPFEPVRIYFVRNYNELGFEANKPYVVPAIWALWASKAIDKQIREENIHTAVNVLALATALESGGQSLTLRTFITRLAGVAATVDVSVQEAKKNLSLAEFQNQQPYFEAWDEFYTGVMIADGVINLAAAVNYKAIAGKWSKLNDYLKSAGSNVSQSLRNAWNSIKVMKAGEIITDIEYLAEYGNIRKYLGNSRIKQYLNNSELNAFENTIRTAHPDVLKYMNTMDEFDFAEMVRGYRDLSNSNKLNTFVNAIKSADDFYGKYGWLTYWKLTPSIKYALTTIDDLRSANKLLPTGNATDVELASLQAFTQKGDFINIPLRYNPSYLGDYAEKGLMHIKNCLEELKKVPERKVVNERVYSGKAFSKADFEKLFVGGAGKEIEYKSFISTSKEQSVAEGFVELTKKWAGNGEKVAVIQRIVSKEGIYIDDLSDWGEHLGKIRHANEPASIQVQREVLLNPGSLKQVGEPAPIMENGVHKMIDGMKAYYIDLVQIVN